MKQSLTMGWEKRRIEVGMPELFSLKINHGEKWSESAYMERFEAWFDYVDKDFISFFEIDEMEGLRLIEQDQDVAEMCKYVPGVREIEMYLEHLNPKQAALKHKLLMNLDENAILTKGVIIDDIEESRVAISITKGSGSKLKKGRAKGGADDLEKWLCFLNDIAYNGDDEHEAEATEGGQGSGDEAEDGPLNADNEGDEDDEIEEGHEAKEVNEGTEVFNKYALFVAVNVEDDTIDSEPQHLRHHNPLSHRSHALRKLHNLHLSQLKPLKPLQSLLQEVRKGGGIFHDVALML
ncbi:hypothetical protein DVH24_019309 [Malus domestica]|uniref:Uncharacterized protein n=1 Tax=Malus domestica TaxID=3750 RepID=A0A498I4N3_MALDO|nr:hypothetical protein DVH24_019309 [Malus domestica]